MRTHNQAKSSHLPKIHTGRGKVRIQTQVCLTPKVMFLLISTLCFLYKLSVALKATPKNFNEIQYKQETHTSLFRELSSPNEENTVRISKPFSTKMKTYVQFFF